MAFEQSQPDRVPARIGGIPYIDTHRRITTGRKYYSNSVDGSNDNVGSINHPFATLDYAIGKCRANRGDTIYLKENHGETLSATVDAVDFDINGIHVIGVGTGSDRPTFTYATATGAVINVDAANIEIENCVFICNIASQTRMFNITGNGDGFHIHDCELREGTATGLSMIEWTGVADDVEIDHNYFYAPTAGNYDEAILIASTPTRGRIHHNFIYGDWDEGGINNATGNIATLFDIGYNVITNLLTNVEAINLDSAVTGVIHHNALSTDTFGTAIDQGSMRCIENKWASTTDGTSGVDVPGTPASTATADSVLGALYGTGGIGTFPAAAIPANNVSLAEVIRQLYAALEGTAASQDGVATWPTAAAYANGVSIAEVLAYIQDGTRRGTGTSLAANESLADVLYAAGGIATFPAAANPANAVSIAEVLRSVWEKVSGGAAAITSNPLLGLKVNKTAATIPQTTTQDIFTVSGGRVLITSLTGEVTTVLGAVANNLSVNLVTTVGGDIVLASVVDVNADEAGTLYVVEGDGTALVPQSSGAVLWSSGSGPMIVAEGTINIQTSASTTGATSWELWYIPLDTGASVASA